MHTTTQGVVLSTTEGFSGALDLSGADTSGFSALDSGTYDVELFSWEMAATKGGQNEDGTQKKMPEGTPMLKVQLKVIEPEFENRRLFDQFVLPPADYDAEKRSKMLGALVRFLVALGMEENDVKKKSFKLTEALEELVGNPARATVAKKPKYKSKPEDEEYDNEVKGYKRAGDGSPDARGGKLL
jgi:hypothetical protein